MNDLIILTSLLDGPKHGYEIKKMAGTILGEGELHNNLVYPALHRFERLRWVARKKVPGKRGQTRFVYRLTPKGRTEMVRSLERYPDDGPAEEGFYLRVGLFAILPPEARRRILDAREQELRHEGEHFHSVQTELEPPRFLGGEVLGYLERRVRTELAWIGRLRREGVSQPWEKVIPAKRKAAKRRQRAKGSGA